MDIALPGNYYGAITRAKEIFRKGNPKEMVIGSGAAFDERDQCFSLDYCGVPIVVTYPTGEVYERNDPMAQLPVNEAYVILLYLAEASGLPQRNQWLTFLELPGGPHHYVPFIQEAIEPLRKTFGECLDNAWLAAMEMKGARTDMSDLGFYLPVFPKLGLQFVFWQGDEEFPMKANILFNEIAETYLDTATLYMLGINVAYRLVEKHKHKE